MMIYVAKNAKKLVHTVKNTQKTGFPHDLQQQVSNLQEELDDLKKKIEFLAEFGDYCERYLSYALTYESDESKDLTLFVEKWYKKSYNASGIIFLSEKTRNIIWCLSIT